MAVHGTRRRESVSWDYAGLLQLLSSLAMERTRLPLLRCYWYEATVEGRRSADHDTLADLPGVKLRVAKMRPGRREGVEGEIHRDLTTLARNKAVSDVMVVTAEEDLAQVIADVQDMGMRVTLLHIAVDGNWTISRTLRQECDDIVEISAAHLRPYVELISGAEPPRPDESVNGNGVNGHAPAAGRIGAYGHPQGRPGAGKQPAAPVAVEAAQGEPGQPERADGAVVADYTPLADFGASADYSTSVDYGAAAEFAPMADHAPAADQGAAVDYGSALEYRPADYGPVPDYAAPARCRRCPRPHARTSTPRRSYFRHQPTICPVTATAWPGSARELTFPPTTPVPSGSSRCLSRSLAADRLRSGGCLPVARCPPGRIRASRRVACRRPRRRPPSFSRWVVFQRSASRPVASRPCRSPRWYPWTPTGWDTRVLAGHPPADHAMGSRDRARQEAQAGLSAWQGPACPQETRTRIPIRSLARSVLGPKDPRCLLHPNRPHSSRRSQGGSRLPGPSRRWAGSRVPSGLSARGVTRAALPASRSRTRCNRRMRKGRRSANRWRATPRRCGLRPSWRGSPGCPRT